MEGERESAQLREIIWYLIVKLDHRDVEVSEVVVAAAGC